MTPPGQVRGAALLAVLLLLTGCTAAESPAGSAQVSSSSTEASIPSTAPPTATPTSPPSPSITLVAVQHLTVGKPYVTVTSLDLTPTSLAASVLRSGASAQVLRFDLSTGDRTVVATSQWQAGEINSVAASGSWVVWVDQDKAMPYECVGQAPGACMVQWNVQAKNVKTGRQITLGSGDTTTGNPPLLLRGGGYIGWSHYDPQRGMAQYLWTPGRAQPRVLTPRLKEFGGASAIADGQLIYLKDVNQSLWDSHRIGDCWSYPIDGSSKGQAITHTGLVQECTASGTDVVWIEPPTLKSFKRSPVEKLMTLSLAGTSGAQTIFQGQMVGLPGFAPVAGTGFVWWVPENGLSKLTLLSAQASVALPGGRRATDVVTGGQLLAYGTQGSTKWTIYVDQVQTTP